MQITCVVQSASISLQQSASFTLVQFTVQCRVNLFHSLKMQWASSSSLQRCFSQSAWLSLQYIQCSAHIFHSNRFDFVQFTSAVQSAYISLVPNTAVLFTLGLVCCSTMAISFKRLHQCFQYVLVQSNTFAPINTLLISCCTFSMHCLSNSEKQCFFGCSSHSLQCNSLNSAIVQCLLRKG